MLVCRDLDVISLIQLKFEKVAKIHHRVSCLMKKLQTQDKSNIIIAVTHWRVSSPGVKTITTVSVCLFLIKIPNYYVEAELTVCKSLLNDVIRFLKMISADSVNLSRFESLNSLG